MAGFCQTCGKKLPFLQRRNELCRKCRGALEGELQSRLANVEKSIASTRACTAEQLAVLKSYDHEIVLHSWFRLYKQFTVDNQLDMREIVALNSIRTATGLSMEETRYFELIQPFTYVISIQGKRELPTVNVPTEGGWAPILQQGEIIHFACRPVNLFKKIETPHAGAPGTSFRVTNRARYLVGAALKNTKNLLIGGGTSCILFITNKRVYLQPTLGHNLISIPLNKVLHFTCYRNGMRIWKQGREKAFLFTIPNAGMVETCAISLMFLLDQIAEQRQSKESNPFRHIPTEVKERVLARDGGRCVMCRKSEGIHFDHILPVSKGGDNTEDNIQILCKECNLRKHDKII